MLAVLLLQQDDLVILLQHSFLAHFFRFFLPMVSVAAKPTPVISKAAVNKVITFFMFCIVFGVPTKVNKKTFTVI